MRDEQVKLVKSAKWINEEKWKQYEYELVKKLKEEIEKEKEQRLKLKEHMKTEYL